MSESELVRLKKRIIALNTSIDHIKHLLGSLPAPGTRGRFGGYITVSPQAIANLQRQINELTFRRDDAQMRLAHLEGRQAGVSDPAQAKGTTRTKEPRTDAKNRPLNFRSEVRRAISLELTKEPGASDLEICRGLDNDGGFELPEGWQDKSGNREFVAAYLNSLHKHKIEKTISSVRTAMREKGLLPGR